MGETGPPAAKVVPWDAGTPTREKIVRRFHARGLDPHTWGNAAGDRYGWHSHSYRKVLYCESGSIVFHTRSGDVELRPGDRLELEAGCEHAATVGPEGVTCLEAPDTRP